MSEVLSKVLWRLYLFILIVSISFLVLGSSILWKSFIKEAKTELAYSNKIVTRSFVSLLNKNEALFHMTGERLLELGLLKNNSKSIQLLDKLLINNPELAGIGIANPEGELILSSSNFNTENLPNLLQKKETKRSFNKALRSQSLVMGRTYFLDEFNGWIIPVRYSIRDKYNQVVAVFTTGIKVTGNDSPWQNANIDHSLRISIINSDYYYQFASFVKTENLSQLYSQPVRPDYLKNFSHALMKQAGFTLEEFMSANHGIAFLEAKSPAGDNLFAAISFNRKHGQFIISGIQKSVLISQFFVPMGLISSLLLGFNIILFGLFRHLSQLQRKSKSDLNYQSEHDQLTGLPNIRYLSSQNRYLKHKFGESFSIIFIDLDNFKNSNDIHGHSVGDKILYRVAQRLKNVFANGLCIRQGGDEFIVIIPGSNQNKTEDLCHGFLTQLRQPIKVNDFEFSIRASIGISQAPVDGKEIETLLSKADIAMYEAKRKKCEVFVFTQLLDKKNARNAMIGKELNHALSKDELSLVYQPQYDVLTKNIIGVEVLLRWNNDILGQVLPSEFIPIAESTGAIMDIGKFVFENAFIEFDEICKEYIEGEKRYSETNRFRLAVNVSILQLSNDKFLDHLFELMKKHDCKKAKLMLEITETLLISNLSKVGVILDKIRQSGIEVSLDDFGTGYSSLSYLSHLPFNELKIDKSFVQGMTSDKNSLTLIKSILNLGKSLGVDVLAEGVENLNQFKMLKKHKCKSIQGFYFSKPMDKRDLLNYLRKQHT